MIAEIGHYALIMSVFVVLIQATLPLWGAKQGNVGLMALAKPAAQLQFALVFGAFLALTHLFVTSDFSVAVVAGSLSGGPALAPASGDSAPLPSSCSSIGLDSSASCTSLCSSSVESCNRRIACCSCGVMVRD